MPRTKTVITVTNAHSCPKLHRVYGPGEPNDPALICMHPKTTTGKCVGGSDLSKDCPGIGCDVWTRWEE